MIEQTSALEILQEALASAQVGNWRQAQESCAVLVNHAPPVGAVARLNILICQYQLGNTQLIPERALPLLSHLPVTGWLPCAGLALLAARKNGELSKLKPLVLALANPKFKAWDLPSVPTYVMLQPDMASCMVLESNDAALMSEIVQNFLGDRDLTTEEQTQLQSLGNRYLERAVATAAHFLEQKQVGQPQKPWWKFW